MRERVINNIEKYNNQIKKPTELKRQDSTMFKVGYEVLLHTKIYLRETETSKLSPKYSRPFQVKRVLSEETRELQLPRGQKANNFQHHSDHEVFTIYVTIHSLTF
jgi:hypothetical protein